MRANNLIEEFHTLSKSALKAYNTDQWTVALPTILLDSHAVFNDEI